MLFSQTFKLLSFPSITALTRNKSSNFYIGKNVRLRNYHKKFPLAGLKVTVLKQQPFHFSYQLIPKLFENFGAEITTFCDTSNFNTANKNIDLNWTNSDFVKAHVYGSPKSVAEAGEREIDLSVDEDFYLVKKFALKSDIFIAGLDSKKFEEAGLNGEEILKMNSKLIFVKINSAKFGQICYDCDGKDVSEEYLELLRKYSKTQTILAQMASFAKILLTFFNTQKLGKGQILDLSVTDSLQHIDRIISTLPSPSPKEFDRFYLTKDKQIFALCLSSTEDQQNFLKSLNLTTPKEISARIKEYQLSDINVFLKGVNDAQTLSIYGMPISHNSAKLQNDAFYEFDRKRNHWIKNNFYHFSPTF